MSVSAIPLETHKRFIINATKQQYIDLEEEEEEDDSEDSSDSDKDRCMVHPLPILLAFSSRGDGGDYRGTNDHLVGLWVGDRVYTDNFIPDGYDKVKITNIIRSSGFIWFS